MVYFAKFCTKTKKSRYKSLNPEEKEKLLCGRAEWYKTLDLQTKIRSYHKSKLIRKSIETQFNVI